MTGGADLRRLYNIGNTTGGMVPPLLSATCLGHAYRYSPAHHPREQWEQAFPA